MSLMHFGVSQSNILFTFSFSIFILSSPITTPKNSTSFTFYLYFSSFTYKLFSSNLFIISATNSSCSSSSSVSTITLSMNTITFPVLIESLSNLFIIIWKVASEFVKPKNITVGLNDLSRVVNAAFHLSPFLILTLLYLHLKFIFINTFFILIFSTISKIKGKG